jgi:cation-transporting ATPase 13A3/4/5
MWTSSDISNVLVMGDNYESEVLFVVGGAQYISTAMALNFGYEFRKGWFHNYVFVLLVIGFTAMHFYVTLNPGDFSCFWRVNCDNEHVQISVTDTKIPIQNDFNTTLMPNNFQRVLLGLVVGNALATSGWEYFVVNGIRRRAKKLQDQNSRTKKLASSQQPSDEEVSES